MAKASDQLALKSAVQGRKFDPVYYLYGDDDFLKNEAVRVLTVAAVDPAMQAFNLDQRRGVDLDGEELGVLLSTPPMMAERRAVVIRGAAALRKDARAALDKYLAKPAGDTVLVLVAGADEKQDKKLTEQSTAVEFGPLTGTQLPKWIARRVEQAGGEIAPDAVALLQDTVGSDLPTLDLEIEKLLNYAAGRRITEDDVAAIAGVRRDETVGHLLDAVAARDASAALAALPLVLQQPKVSAVTIVMALTVQTLALAWGEARGLPSARLSGEYFSLLKGSGSVFTGRSWGEAVSTWTRTVSRWSRQDLTAALATLARADEALKESRLSSESQVLSTLILSLCRTSAGHKVA